MCLLSVASEIPRQSGQILQHRLKANCVKLSLLDGRSRGHLCKRKLLRQSLRNSIINISHLKILMWIDGNIFVCCATASYCNPRFYVLLLFYIPLINQDNKIIVVNWWRLKYAKHPNHFCLPNWIVRLFHQKQRQNEAGWRGDWLKPKAIVYFKWCEMNEAYLGIVRALTKYRRKEQKDRLRVPKYEWEYTTIANIHNF